MISFVLHNRSARKKLASWPRTKFVLPLLALGAATGCREPARRSPPAPARRTEAHPEAASSVPPAVSTLFPELQAPVDTETDPVAPAGDLAAEIAEFTDLAACAKRHALVDPVLFDAVDALGYDRFAYDACRTIQALKTHDAGACGKILSTPLARRCEAGVAMLDGKPELCPTIDRVAGVPEHETDCLAVASRDVRRCAVLDGMDRATCEGLVARDPARCGTTERCARLVRRWKPVLPTVLGQTPYAARIDLEVRTVDDAADGGVRVENVSLAREAAAGAVLARIGTTFRLAIGDPRAFRVVGEQDGGGFVVEFADATPGEKTSKSPSDRVTVRRASGLVQELTTGTQPKVVIDELSQDPGGPVKLRLEASVGPPAQARVTRWTVDTWLRDRVDVQPKDAGR